MCIRRQVRYKCSRCGGVSRKDGSVLETCGNSFQTANRVCSKVKLEMIPRFEKTTGRCDSCGARPGDETYRDPKADGSRQNHAQRSLRRGVRRQGPLSDGVDRAGRLEGIVADDAANGDSSTAMCSDPGVGAVLTPAEVEDAMEIERQFFARRDRQQPPVEEGGRYDELQEAKRWKFEAQNTANEEHLEEQAAHIKWLNEQRTKMEDQFAEARSGNSGILAKQEENISQLRDEKEVLRTQIDQEQSRLEELRGTRRGLERDAELDLMDLEWLRWERHRIEDEVQDMRSTRDNMRLDRQASSSYPSRFTSPDRRQSSHGRADRPSAGSHRFEERPERYRVVWRPARNQSFYRSSGSRGAHHHRRGSSADIFLNNYII